MDVQIRPIREREIPLLEEFLYEAIWQPGPGKRLPREVVYSPALRPYVEAFGEREGDCCLVGMVGGRVVGAVWCRCLHGYGWVDAATPELAVALCPEWRGRGIGTQLLRAMLDELRRRGFCAVSLSVQRDNPAARLYPRLGFRVAEERGGEWIMLCELR